MNSRYLASIMIEGRVAEQTEAASAEEAETWRKAVKASWGADGLPGEPEMTVTAVETGEDKETVTSWETTAGYLARFPDDDGTGTCEVAVQVGQGRDGRWYLRTADDAGGSDEADDTSYPDKDAAIEAANSFALEHDDPVWSCRDINGLLVTLDATSLDEAREEIIRNGDWCGSVHIFRDKTMVGTVTPEEYE